MQEYIFFALDYRYAIFNLIVLIEANKINKEIKNKRLEMKRLQYKLQDM